MTINQRLFGTVVGSVVLFVLGWLIWERLLPGFFESNAGSATGVMRDSQLVWSVALGTLSYGALITLVIASRPRLSLFEGLKTGAVVGLLMWFGVDFIYYGFGNLWNLTATVVDPLLEGLRASIAGLAIVAARNVVS
jgi:hypothetical protein